MTIINTKTNESHEGVSKAEASRIIGVHRKTIRRWEVERQRDGSYKEEFNHFTIYFKIYSYRQAKGRHLNSNP